jgi:peptidyl-prolyl cis-trans isomerase-like 4
VCKLNQVTTDQDLETIFSRFGEILSCEIVRDKKTGDSLCYAFIEYDNKEDAEQAFFKMDNVLIDDRRIHVDFSQSVAKAKWEYDKKQRRLKALKKQVPPPQQQRASSPPRSSSSSKRHKVEESRHHDRDYHRRDHDHDRHRRDSDRRDHDHDRHRTDSDRDHHRRDQHRYRRDRSKS